MYDRRVRHPTAAAIVNHLKLRRCFGRTHIHTLGGSENLKQFYCQQIIQIYGENCPTKSTPPLIYDP